MTYHKPVNLAPKMQEKNIKILKGILSNQIQIINIYIAMTKNNTFTINIYHFVNLLFVFFLRMKSSVKFLDDGAYFFQ